MSSQCNGTLDATSDQINKDQLMLKTVTSEIQQHLDWKKESIKRRQSSYFDGDNSETNGPAISALNGPLGQILQSQDSLLEQQEACFSAQKDQVNISGMGFGETLNTDN